MEATFILGLNQGENFIFSDNTLNEYFKVTQMETKGKNQLIPSTMS